MTNLAQVNLARLKYAFDDPRIADFVDGLERINALAEQSDGFVWRFVDETGELTAAGGFDDPAVVVNMSVWRDASSLERFVWNTAHGAFYRRRAEWFDAMPHTHFAMWWVGDGHEPTAAEAKSRLDYLGKNGDSDHAFGWSDLPHVKLWQQARCA